MQIMFGCFILVGQDWTITFVWWLILSEIHLQPNNQTLHDNNNLWTRANSLVDYGRANRAARGGARPAVIPLRLTVREALAPAGSFLTLTADPNTLYTCFCVENFTNATFTAFPAEKPWSCLIFPPQTPLGGQLRCYEFWKKRKQAQISRMLLRCSVSQLT